MSAITNHKPIRSLLEQLELAVKLGSHEELESAANELLATVKYDSFKLTWAENGNYEEYTSIYPENIERRLRQIPYDTKVCRLSRTCGHCGNTESIAHSSGHVNQYYENVKYVLQKLETVKEL